jgi:hypothetical protein
MRWSADWPGAMAGLVEKETGAPCLFLQGAAGDLTIDRGRGNTPELFGEQVAKEVLAVARGVRCEPVPAATLQMAEEDFTFASRRPRANKPGGSPLASFYEREYQMGVRPHLSVALLIGRIDFVGVYRDGLWTAWTSPPFFALPAWNHFLAFRRAFSSSRIRFAAGSSARFFSSPGSVW